MISLSTAALLSETLFSVIAFSVFAHLFNEFLSEATFFWILFCIINYILGKKREIGGWKALLFSIFFSPIAGFILVVFSKNKADWKREEEALQLLRTIAANTTEKSASVHVQSDNNPITDDEI